MAELREDELPDVPSDLFPSLVEETCLAVAGYIGKEWGWDLVELPYRSKESTRMWAAWTRLPESSRAIIIDEAARSGYKGKPTTRLLPLVWLSKRQRQARYESIVSIAMRCLAHEDWLK